MKKLLSGLVILGLMSSAPAMAAGSDELWAVSSKMDMPGMPMGMPGQTSNVCLKKGNEKDPNNAIPKNNDQDCKMSDVKIVGNKTTWKMKCDGRKPMEGEGEMTRGNGSYSGKTVFHMKRRDMTMVYEGKRIGTCQAK